MCLASGQLPDGTEIPCRECWQCRNDKINDWVGRCIAENKTSKAAHFITLTYGKDDEENSDHIRTQLLTYSDVQKYFKLLRSKGYIFRYLVAGEYGSLKGRSHWHLIMYWKNVVPPHELTDQFRVRRFTDRNWPHGHQVWKKVTPETVRYVCKYINKDIGKDERQAHFSMSKKPPLGFDYFNDLAEKYAIQGLAPQNLIYSFNEYKKHGKKVDFRMTGTTADNFIKKFIEVWPNYNTGHVPSSELIEKYEDSLIDYEGLGRDRFYDPVKTPNGSPPLSGKDPTTDSMGIFYKDDFGYYNWYRNIEGEYQWQRESLTERSQREKKIN